MHNYHVEQDREACSNRDGLSNIYPHRCNEFRANSDTVCRSWVVPSVSGPGSCVISLVLKLFCIPKALDRAAQLLIKSFPSSNHMISDLLILLSELSVSFHLKYERNFGKNVIYRLVLRSGFGLEPLYSLKVTSRCFPNDSAAGDTENSDKSVVASVSDFSIRHETDKAWGIGFWVVILGCVFVYVTIANSYVLLTDDDIYYKGLTCSAMMLLCDTLS